MNSAAIGRMAMLMHIRSILHSIRAREVGTIILAKLLPVRQQVDSIPCHRLLQSTAKMCMHACMMMHLHETLLLTIAMRLHINACISIGCTACNLMMPGRAVCFTSEMR